MALKQESAMEDSAAMIGSVVDQFQTMGLPRLADPAIYLGMPMLSLESLSQALDSQRYDDEKRRFASRLRLAGIAKERVADAFKWGNDTYPLTEPSMIEYVLSIEFVRQQKNLIVAGPPGVGKSLLVVVVACKAIRAGFSAKYKTAHNIAMELREARLGNSLSKYVKKLQACDLLVVEDVTFATFDAKAAQSFFSLIDDRYGRKTTVITSNGSINEWAGNFPDKRMGAALLGRFYEEALLINMNGAEDMRLKRAKGALENIGCGTSSASM
jgi:DNA replication protein DnaC